MFDLLTQMRVGDKETLDGPDNKSKANGTGPFALVDWTPGESVRLTKNKNYWQSGLPYLDGYDVLFSRDGQAMIATLEAGASDFVNYPLASEAIRLSKDPKYQMQAIFDVGSHYAIWMNVAVPPLDNKLVRQALNYAIDRQRFIDTALGGLVGPPMNLPWPTYSPAYEASKNNTYPFDLDKARSLLAAAGVSSFDTIINYANTGEIAEFSTMAQIYQADLAKIGVNATIQPLDNATWTDSAVKATYKGLAVGHPGGFGAQDATSGLQTGALWHRQHFYQFQRSGVHADRSGRGGGGRRGQTQAAVLKGQRHHPRQLLHDAAVLAAPGVTLDEQSARHRARALRWWPESDPNLGGVSPQAFSRVTSGFRPRSRRALDNIRYRIWPRRSSNV